jgi:hypothetical protein
MKKDKKSRLCAAGMAWLLLLGGSLLLSGCDEPPELEEILAGGEVPDGGGDGGGEVPDGGGDGGGEDDGGALGTVLAANSFSNGTGATGSAIDLIKAAKDAGSTSVTVNLSAGTETEVVQFADETDLGTGGLVLTHTGDQGTWTSPAEVTIDGGGGTVALPETPDQHPHPLITVGSGVTLTLKNITFTGSPGDGTHRYNSSLIKVNSGGTLILETGAGIKGNTRMWFDTVPGAGGVTVFGTLIMNGGEISGNKTTSDSNNGGGVYVGSGGIFTMNGGIISNNAAGDLSYGAWGGGVYVGNNGAFTMSGGTISGNYCKQSGGGVRVYDNAVFKKTGGTIYGSDAADSLKNTASVGGHAVSVSTEWVSYDNTMGETDNYPVP